MNDSVGHFMKEFYLAAKFDPTLFARLFTSTPTVDSLMPGTLRAKQILQRRKWQEKFIRTILQRTTYETYDMNWMGAVYIRILPDGNRLRIRLSDSFACTSHFPTP